MVLAALLVAGCGKGVLEGAPLLELHAINDEKRATKESVLEKRGSGQDEVSIGFFY